MANYVASSKKRTRKRRTRGSFILSLLLFVSVVFATYHLFQGIFDFLRDPNRFHVSRVIINGNLKYISQKEVADNVGKFAGGQNIVTLDLALVHNALVQMPWVASASVYKRMPDTLVVSLVEHYPSALWKNNGIYDAVTRSVFYPDMSKYDFPLVSLSAPHDSLASDVYDHAYEFIKIMQGSPYSIKEVQQDIARGYRVKIEGDVWLILGRDGNGNLPLQRLKRFVLAFGKTQLKLSEVSYVDLRYDNGFAVGEREQNQESETNQESTAKPKRK